MQILFYSLAILYCSTLQSMGGEQVRMASSFVSRGLYMTKSGTWLQRILCCSLHMRRQQLKTYTRVYVALVAIIQLLRLPMLKVEKEEHIFCLHSILNSDRVGEATYLQSVATPTLVEVC